MKFQTTVKLHPQPHLPKPEYDFLFYFYLADSVSSEQVNFEEQNQGAYHTYIHTYIPVIINIPPY